MNQIKITMIKKVAIGFVVLLVAIQAIRPSKNTDTRVITSQELKMDENTLSILDKACLDCHSNNSRYLWYSEIMPVGWLISHDIDEGKEHLNFSEWANYSDKKKDHKLDEVVEMMEKGEMPLAIYLPTHPEAKLAKQEVDQLISWANNYRKELNFASEKE